MYLFLQSVKEYLYIILVRSTEFRHVRRSIVHDLLIQNKLKKRRERNDDNVEADEEQTRKVFWGEFRSEDIYCLKCLFVQLFTIRTIQCVRSNTVKQAAEQHEHVMTTNNLPPSIQAVICKIVLLLLRTSSSMKLCKVCPLPYSLVLILSILRLCVINIFFFTDAMLPLGLYW